MRKFLKSKVGFLNPSKEILNIVPLALPGRAASAIMAGQVDGMESNRMLKNND